MTSKIQKGLKWVLWLFGCTAMLTVLFLIFLAFDYAIKKQQLPKSAGGPLYERLSAKPTMRFFVLGDSGVGNANQMAVAEAMERRCRQQEVDGIIHVGDVFYQTGVQSIDDPKWQSRVLKPYGGPCLRDKSIYFVFGNHDYSGNADAEIEFSQKKPAMGEAVPVLRADLR